MRLVASCDMYKLYYALGSKVRMYVYNDGSREIYIVYRDKIDRRIL